jgi:hypothetical protein
MMIGIETIAVNDDKEENETSGKSQRKTCQADGRICFLSQQIPDGRCQNINEHLDRLKGFTAASIQRSDHFKTTCTTHILSFLVR